MTSSPTLAYDPVYWTVLEFSILASIVIFLLCCGCIARVRNDSTVALKLKEYAPSRALKLSNELNEIKSNSPDDLKKIEEISNELEELQKQLRLHEKGLTAAADALISAGTGNQVSKDLEEFFYHSSLGRLLLLGNQGALNIVCALLMIIFSGLTVTYLNAHVLPLMENPAQGTLDLIMFLGALLIIVSIFRDQYGIFLSSRLGGTGVIDRTPDAMDQMLLQQKKS